MKQPAKYKAINLREGLTVTEAVKQFRVSKIIDRDCTSCNPGGGMEQIDYFSKLPQILVFIPLMDSWKMRSFSEILTEQYVVCLIYLCLFN